MTSNLIGNLVKRNQDKDTQECSEKRTWPSFDENCGQDIVMAAMSSRGDALMYATDASQAHEILTSRSKDATTGSWHRY